MTLELFAHPFSSYCQKALIAFYENDIPFETSEARRDQCIHRLGAALLQSPPVGGTSDLPVSRPGFHDGRTWGRQPA